MSIPTPHIECKEQGIIAENSFITRRSITCKIYCRHIFRRCWFSFNTVRNMFGYTGTYKGEKNLCYGIWNGDSLQSEFTHMS